MTSEEEERPRLVTGSYGRHKGQWVNYIGRFNVLLRCSGYRHSNLVPRVSPQSKQGETLAHADHMSPRIWEMTIKLLKGWVAW